MILIDGGDDGGGHGGLRRRAAEHLLVAVAGDGGQDADALLRRHDVGVVQPSCASAPHAPSLVVAAVPVGIGHLCGRADEVLQSRMRLFVPRSLADASDPEELFGGLQHAIITDLFRPYLPRCPCARAALDVTRVGIDAQAAIGDELHDVVNLADEVVAVCRRGHQCWSIGDGCRHIAKATPCLSDLAAVLVESPMSDVVHVKAGWQWQAILVGIGLRPVVDDVVDEVWYRSRRQVARRWRWQECPRGGTDWERTGGGGEEMAS